MFGMFFMLTIGLPMLVISALIIWVVVKRSKIGEVVEAQVAKAERVAQSADPKALLDLRIHKAEERIRKGQENLVKIRVPLNQAIERIKVLDSMHSGLDALLKANPNQQDAEKMADVERRLEEMKKIRDTRQAEYNSLMKAIQEGWNEVKRAKDEAIDIDIQLSSSISQDEIDQMTGEDFTVGISEAKAIAQSVIDQHDAARQVRSDVQGHNETHVINNVDVSSILARYQTQPNIKE